MALLLTFDQEQRIHAVVSAGAYPSVEEALNAAVTAIETAASVNFEGAHEELQGLLMEGLASPELSEDQFWNAMEEKTNAMLAAHRPKPPA